jgi:hypothetical protein
MLIKMKKGEKKCYVNYLLNEKRGEYEGPYDDVGLSASGKLDRITINLATKLKIPHHQGAGGEDDFTGKEAFQKQLKRKEREKNSRNKK